MAASKDTHSIKKKCAANWEANPWDLIREAEGPIVSHSIRGLPILRELALWKLLLLS